MRPAALHVRVSRVVIHGAHSDDARLDAAQVERLIVEQLKEATDVGLAAAAACDGRGAVDASNGAARVQRRADHSGGGETRDLLASSIAQAVVRAISSKLAAEPAPGTLQPHPRGARL